MERIQARFVGVELYFENLEGAKKFYIETMGLEVSDEQAGHHAKFDSGAGFIWALNENLDKCASYAAFWKATNSVLVAAKRCAFSSR